MSLPRNLSFTRVLWIDAIAALSAGTLLLIFRDFGAEIFHLPVELLGWQAFIALCFAAFSLSLARRKSRPRRMLQTLAAGNVAYSFFCLVLLVVFYADASAYGVAYFLADIFFVGGWGGLEFSLLQREAR